MTAPGLRRIRESPGESLHKSVLDLVVLALSLCACASAPGAPADREFAVIAYYHGSNPEEVDRYPVEKLTHIIYSFLHLDGDALAQPGAADDATIRHLVALKDRFPRLNVQVAVGGWGGCETCSDVFASAAGRREFAMSVLDLYREYGIDGLDLDWEYPAIEGFPGHTWRPADKQNFTLLMRILRQTLPDEFELTFAAGAYSEYLENSVEWEQVMPLVNRVHLMTYDLVNGFSPVTGHHTPLFSTDRQKASVDHAVRFLLDRGTAAGKIVIGAAFYARVWRDVDISSGTPLYQPGIFKETIAFRDYDGTLADGFRHFWDERAKAPYRYSEDRREFATFDDRASVTAKVAYAAGKGLGGIMFWQLAGDRTEGGLLMAIDEAVREHFAPAQPMCRHGEEQRAGEPVNGAPGPRSMPPP